MSDDLESSVCFGGMTPILRVSNADASMDYYTRVLGFRNDCDVVSGFAWITRDDCHPCRWLKDEEDNWCPAP